MISVGQKHTLAVALTTSFITTFMGSALNLAIPNIEGEFLVDVMHFRAENRRVMAEGGKTATGRTELMGITKASLATDS